MRPPGWLIVEMPRGKGIAPDGKSIMVTLRVRKWHPGFWLFAIRTIWRAYR